MPHDKKKYEKLISWLNNAYAMENQIIEVLQSHKSDAKDYPEVQDKIQEHIELTHDHANAVKECIVNLGGEVPEIQAGGAKIMGNIMGFASGIMEDKVILNSILEYSAENTEIAVYQAIHQAALQLDENDIATVCQKILEEEIEMASWLQENLPELVAEEFVPEEESK